MEQEPRVRSLIPPLVLGAAAVLLFAGGGAFLWILNSRVDTLRSRVSGVERRADATEQDLVQKSREAEALQRQLIAAQQQTTQLQAANHASEAQVQQLQEESASNAAAAQQALKEKQAAVTSQQQTAGELEQMRRRRAAELDHMQQALARIAPTVRTPSGMVMQLANESFKFDFDSAALRPENREILSRVAGVLLASEGYRLFIDGHTDDVGTDAYNQRLSERRAATVRDYLVKAGVPAEIITVKGFGKSNPFMHAKTAAAREKNRRVEIGIVDTIINYPGLGISNH